MKQENLLHVNWPGIFDQAYALVRKQEKQKKTRVLTICFQKHSGLQSQVSHQKRSWLTSFCMKQHHTVLLRHVSKKSVRALN